MGEEQLNWVERRHAAEEHLADSKPILWRDLCAAMKDASRSFNKLYAGSSETKVINGHRFRVIKGDGAKTEAEIDFDDQSGVISVAYDAATAPARQFTIKSDHRSAFIADGEGKRMIIDAVCYVILAPLFFPEPSGAATIDLW